MKMPILNNSNYFKATSKTKPKPKPKPNLKLILNYESIPMMSAKPSPKQIARIATTPKGESNQKSNADRTCTMPNYHTDTKYDDKKRPMD
jgi:hypothetical protein